MPSFGFVLFSPDAVVLGLESRALALLEGRGFGVIAWQWLTVDRTRTARLYELNRANKVDRALDGLIDRLFEIGTSLACLFAYPGDDAPSQLTAFKGPARPSRCESTHLRRILGSENAILNRLHASDSSSSVKYEAELFLGGAATGPTVPGQSVIRSRPGCLPVRSSTSALEVCARLKEHLIGAEHGRSRLGYLLKEEFACAGKLLKDQRDYSRLKELWEEEMNIMKDQGWPKATTSAVAALSDSPLTAEGWRLTTEALSGSGFRVDPWDELIIESEIFCRAKGWV